MGQMQHLLNKIAESPIIGHLAFLLGGGSFKMKKRIAVVMLCVMLI
jgi:hypothetical protein